MSAVDIEAWFIADAVIAFTIAAIKKASISPRRRRRHASASRRKPRATQSRLRPGHAYYQPPPDESIELNETYR